jgi:DNA topoisomerase IA
LQKFSQDHSGFFPVADVRKSLAGQSVEKLLTEAELIQILEANSIGAVNTIIPYIIANIIDRQYVQAIDFPFVTKNQS